MKTKTIPGTARPRHAPYVLLSLVLAGTPAAQAGGLQGLLDVLRQNGTITAEQYAELSSEAARGSAQCTPAEATEQATADTPPKPRKARDKAVAAKFEKEGGLTLRDRDKDLELTIGGRLFIDGTLYSPDDADLGDGVESRAARLTLKGRAGRHWKFKAQYDFAEDSLGVKDLFIRHTGLGFPGGITLGQFKEPFSLEEQTSGKNISFMERAMPVDAFSPGRAIGLGIDTHGQNWSFGSGIFAEAVGDVPANEGDEGWGIAARGTLAPVDGKRRTLHLGTGAAWRRPDADREVRYRLFPESHLTAENLLNTGRISDVDSTLTLGLEATWVEGPFSLQGEFLRARVDRRNGLASTEFDGWYAYASWLVTGESRPYDAGEGAFGRITPRGHWGAWELAVRHSRLDLDDRDIAGGKAESTTLGVNWYVNPRLRFMANYLWINSERRGTTDNPAVLQFRGQLVF